MQTDHLITIVVTFVGFVALAALLLVPVWRFLKREEEVSRKWTPENMPPPIEDRTNGEERHTEGEGTHHGV